MTERQWVIVRQLAAAIKETPGVRRVLLFGSQARGDAQATSDVDLAIDVESLGRDDWNKICELADEAPTLLKIGLIRLDSASVGMRRSVAAEGVEI